MKEEKKKVEETKEEVIDAVVENEEALDLDFNYEDYQYESLKEDEREKVFEKLKKQNLMVLAVLKGYEENVKELQAKAVSRVSEEQFQRLAADFENHKRRSAIKEQSSFQDGQLDVVKELFTMMDTFGMAMPMIKEEGTKKGVELVYKSLVELFAKYKIEEINPLNEEFDPEYHSAVMMEEAQNESDAEKVVEVFQKGYKKENKILRYAQVKVAK